MIPALLSLVLSQACESPYVCLDAEGYARFALITDHQGAYDLGGGFTAGVYSPHGVATKVLAPPFANQSLRIMARRGAADPDPGLVITQETYRGGSRPILAVEYTQQCPGAYALQVGEGNDTIDYGGAVVYEGSQCVSGNGGGLRHINGFSGARALGRIAGQRLVISGAQGAREDMVNADGTRPVCDGGVTTRLTDGGCVYNYAGMHGDIELNSEYAMQQGFAFEVYNPLTGTRADHRALWDARFGAYAQNHGICRADWPGPAQEVFTNLGTAYFGSLPGATMWDRCTNTWHFMKGAWPDGGYVQIVEQPSVDALLSAIVVLEARVAALEATCH